MGVCVRERKSKKVFTLGAYKRKRRERERKKERKKERNKEIRRKCSKERERK